MILKENIVDFIKISTNQAQLLAGSVIKVGGRFFTLSTALTFDRTVSGLGGIDTGSVLANSFYYVYAVQSGGLAYLVASTSTVNPTGYTVATKVGAFITDGSALINLVSILGEVNQQTLFNDVPTSVTTDGSFRFKFTTVLTTSGAPIYVIINTGTYTIFKFLRKASVSVSFNAPNTNGNRYWNIAKNGTIFIRGSGDTTVGVQHSVGVGDTLVDVNDEISLGSETPSVVSTTGFNATLVLSARAVI